MLSFEPLAPWLCPIPASFLNNPHIRSTGVVKTIRQCLRETPLAAALKYENVFSLVTDCYTDTICRESTQIINFDHYSESVWHKLLQGRGLTGSRQDDLGGDVGASIAGTTAKILERTPAHASFETKKSALETLRKMGKSIALGGIR